MNTREITRLVNVAVTEASVDDEGPHFEQIRWTYRPADPYAVTMQPANGPAWRFARDLLADGLDGPAGDEQAGSVLIRPVTTGVAGRGVQVTLRSPDGYAVLEFDRNDIALFLRAVFKAVPRGREHEHTDLDAAVAALLARGGAR